jgi:hypothetical protein
MELMDHLWRLLGWACKACTTVAIPTRRTATVLEHGTPLVIRTHDLGFRFSPPVVLDSVHRCQHLKCDNVPILALKLVVLVISRHILILSSVPDLYKQMF